MNKKIKKKSVDASDKFFKELTRSAVEKEKKEELEEKMGYKIVKDKTIKEKEVKKKMNKNEDLVWQTIGIVILIGLTVGLAVGLSILFTLSEEERVQEKEYLNCMKEFARDYCESEGMRLAENKATYPDTNSWDFLCIIGNERIYNKDYEKFKYLNEELEECKNRSGYRRWKLEQL